MRLFLATPVSLVLGWPLSHPHCDHYDYHDDNYSDHEDEIDDDNDEDNEDGN